MTENALLVLAMIIVATITATQAQTRDEKLAIMRKQFAYGVSLVQRCRSTLHTSDLLVCRNHALGRDAGVTKAIAAGADYGLVAMEYETGTVELTEVLAVRDAVRELTKGDTDAFCYVFGADCAPLKGAIAQMQSTLDVLDKVKKR